MEAVVGNDAGHRPGVGRFPMLSGIASQPDLSLDLDRLFEFGLELLLDGLAVRIQHPTIKT
jgi:hypothetical protein